MVCGFHNYNHLDKSYAYYVVLCTFFSSFHQVFVESQGVAIMCSNVSPGPFCILISSCNSKTCMLGELKSGPYTWK